MILFLFGSAKILHFLQSAKKNVQILPFIYAFLPNHALITHF